MDSLSLRRSIVLCIASTTLAAHVVSGQTISQAGWTLQSADSQETQACCYLAGNAFDDNPNTMWATRWFSASPVPPHEIQINLGAINQVLQNYPAANFYILMYGHNDVAAQRPSGLGLVPGNPGYIGSFKDYMQRMITAIRNAGKSPLLAKHGAVLPLDGPIDAGVQEYNLVINDLAADVNNGVTTVPPDFYSYFRARTTTHYSTPTEPNGLGYQGMAQLWQQVIAP